MVDVVYVWLFGGLGNQLFQINYGEYLRRERGKNVRFIDNLTRRNSLTYLLNWSVHENILGRIFNTESVETLTSVGALSIPILAKSPLFNSYSYYYGLNKWSKNPAKNNFGYFQSKDLLSSGNYISVTPDLILENNNDGWLMHYRSIDASGISHPEAYYEVYYNKVLVSLEPSTINIVSNSSDSLFRLQKKYPKHEFIDVSTNAFEDFVKILSAKKLIMSPSTFSWWGARLGNVSKLIMPADFESVLGQPKVGCEIELY